MRVMGTWSMYDDRTEKTIDKQKFALNNYMKRDEKWGEGRASEQQDERWQNKASILFEIKYYMAITKTISYDSKCTSKKVFCSGGGVIFDNDKPLKITELIASQWI